MPSPGTPPIGTRIGDRYEILDHIGDGTSGSVYRVKDDNLGAVMALKLLNPTAGEPATWDEAQALKRLESPYLLKVHNADVDVVADVRYITMPYIANGDLYRTVRAKPVEPRVALRWASNLAHGLHRIHAGSMLHRDVKPANGFLSNAGDALLGDLGMAVQMEPDGTTGPNGTFVTVAPEVLGNGGRCSVRSDVYSLAATTFFLLSGQYPVDTRGDTAVVARRVKQGDRRRLREVAPHVTQSVATAVEKGLAFNPADRYASALDFANQIGYAKCHKRAWRLISDHASHTLCLEGAPGRLTKGVTICSVPAGGLWNIEITKEGGRRSRKDEKSSVKYDQLLIQLRSLTSRL
jgi:serine/threonine protein kinase